MRPETPFMMMPMVCGVVCSATIWFLFRRGAGGGSRRTAAGKRLPECRSGWHDCATPALRCWSRGFARWHVAVVLAPGGRGVPSPPGHTAPRHTAAHGTAPHVPRHPLTAPHPAPHRAAPRRTVPHRTAPPHRAARARGVSRSVGIPVAYRPFVRLDVNEGGSTRAAVSRAESSGAARARARREFGLVERSGGVD